MTEITLASPPSLNFLEDKRRNAAMNLGGTLAELTSLPRDLYRRTIYAIGWDGAGAHDVLGMELQLLLAGQLIASFPLQNDVGGGGGPIFQPFNTTIGENATGAVQGIGIYWAAAASQFAPVVMQGRITIDTARLVLKAITPGTLGPFWGYVAVQSESAPLS